MKRLLSALLSLALLLSLAGCSFAGSGISTTAPASSPVQTTAPTAQQTDPTEPPTEPTAAETVPEETLPAQTDPVETQPEETFPEDPRPRPTVPEQDQEEVPTQPTEPVQTQPEETQPEVTEPTQPKPYIDPNGSYTTKKDVALYLHLYGRLPGNFITKSQAKNYGWKSGSLEKYAPGKCIGGDRFYNNEGLLPNKSGRYYYECDIDTLGSYSGRGAKRIVYSNDGLIYYTGDHYGSFTLLYGEP